MHYNLTWIISNRACVDSSWSSVRLVFHKDFMNSLDRHLLLINLFVLSFVFLSLPSVTTAQGSIDGHWEGRIVQPTGDLTLAIDIHKTPEGFTGSFDVPAAAVFKFPLNINYTAPKIQMR